MFSVVARLVVAVVAATVLLGACSGSSRDEGESADACRVPRHSVDELEGRIADLQVKPKGQGERPMGPRMSDGSIDDSAGRAWDAARLQQLKGKLDLRDAQARVIANAPDCWDPVVVANARGLLDPR